MKPCDENLIKVIALTEEMILLSDEGDALRDDSGCGVLYGVLRDSAYRIKKMAEMERDSHINKGLF
ncbi:MAG: hypothetical protein GX654_13465 [Desulfatiglans sp.]|jgi:hypothetical protein|nr:hypothetical protein [Desulfatiglans sp.]